MAETFHWADMIARRIIQEKGDKDLYTLASGVTPSGTIHIGKFREVITVEFIARALIKMGKKVRFIYSWDDYDTFRKVPNDMPQQEMLKSLLYQPIVDIPDVYGTESSYARHNEVSLESVAPSLGVSNIEYIYQSEKYRAGDYNDMIIRAMDNRDKIRAILQKFKTQEMGGDWQPVETYCSACNRDRMIFSNYDSDAKTIDCECKLCGHKETLILRESRRLKLPWRIDWPMRWKYENVDFEPGGIDHSSAGGSFDTSKEIVADVFGGAAPSYVKYGNIMPKGERKKMSSSAGNGMSVANVLRVYEPEIVRWFFASYKVDAMFNVAFDDDVIRNYEAFDRMERIVYGSAEETNEEKRAWARSIYEMSQVNADGKIPDALPFQPSIRHLCANLQINDLDIQKTRAAYAEGIKSDRDELRYQERAKRAAYWLKNYAPEEYVFKVNDARRNDMNLSTNQAAFADDLKSALSADWTERDLQNKIGELAAAHGMDQKDAFRLLYQLLIGRDKGPRLAGFILSIGRERIAGLL